MTKVTIGSATHPGQVRSENQDSYACYTPENGARHTKGILLALADGMGGHSGGAVASQLAIDVLLDNYYQGADRDILEALGHAFQAANEKVIEAAGENDAYENMGSTLTAVVIHHEMMYYAHVGDSRGYLIDDGQITQFTEDHSFVADLVKAGAISKDEARVHPEKNLITRAVGIREDLAPDLDRWRDPLKKGQYILICCDGLHGVVEEDQIVNTVTTVKDPNRICETLVGMANANGGPDNVTVIVARIDSTGLLSKVTSKLKIW
jgi:serine/threonine protein phosphatase PrpC